MNLPKMNRAELSAFLTQQHPDYVFDKFLIVGIRGYYKNTMGKPVVNDRSIYDDALFLITDNEFHAFNGNVDPSKYHKHIANLKPGIWPVYKFDIHGGKKAQYPAICQRTGNVTVVRDGEGEETGMFGINIHKGGFKGTSSEGCQTVHPDQWNRFINTANRLCKDVYGDDYKKEVLTYVLLEQ